MAEFDESDEEFQHYVPKLHLNQWRTNNEKGQSKIWVYGKSHPPIFIATGNVGGGENYYRTRRADGTDDNRRIERFLGILEDHAGKIYKKLGSAILCRKPIENGSQSTSGRCTPAVHIGKPSPASW